MWAEKDAVALEFSFLKLADVLVAVAEIFLPESGELLGFVVAAFDGLQVETFLPRNIHVFSVHSEGKSMFLSILIEIANNQLIPIIFHMHGLRLFEGQIKSLLMFQPNQLGDRIILECIFIAAPIQMQDLINKRPFLVDQLIYLEGLVINKHSEAICPLAVLGKRDLDDGFASFIDDFILAHVLKKNRRY